MSPQSNPLNNDLEQMVSVSVSREASECSKRRICTLQGTELYRRQKNLLVIQIQLPNEIPKHASFALVPTISPCNQDKWETAICCVQDLNDFAHPPVCVDVRKNCYEQWLVQSLSQLNRLYNGINTLPRSTTEKMSVACSASIEDLMPIDKQELWCPCDSS